MKSSRFRFLAVSLALLCLLPPGLLQAQAPAPVERPVPPPAAAPADATPPPADTPAAPAAAPETEPADPTLRRIDAPEERSESRRTSRSRSRGRNNDRIAVGDNVTLGPGETATTVVAVFGSATSEGEVFDSVVAVLGSARVTGPVADAVVAVLGNVYVNSKVKGEVVAILGSVELGPEAEVGGEVVAIGGRVTRDPKAIVHGAVNAVPFMGPLGDAEWLRTWFTKCILLGRLLWVGPHLGWAWAVAFSFLAFYLLLALLFRSGFERCAQTLETRPGYSVLAAVLTVLLAPIAIVLLCFTVVGVALVPFLAAGLFFAGLFGKAVMLAWIGRRFTKFFGDGPLGHPAMGVLIGGLIVLGLYMVPVLGILTYKLLGWLGLGVVVYTIMLSMKREKPVAPRPVGPGAGAPMAARVAPHVVAPVNPTVGDPMAMSGVPLPPGVPAQTAGFGAAAPGSMPYESSVPLAPPPPPVFAATMPRAGFMIRLYALALDVILIALIANFLNHLLPHHARLELDPPGFLPLMAIYGALMWKLKGTTVGGIVCGLKVVRVDGRELDWATVIVRALGCFLSLVVVGLGFIWVAIDAERQSWHDKIAGTVVVRMPKGVSLI